MAIAYVVKMFPRISETFITNEVRELERHGLELRLFSLMRPEAVRVWTEIADLVPRIDYLPDPARREEWRSIARITSLSSGGDPGAISLRLRMSPTGSHVRCGSASSRRAVSPGDVKRPA